MNRAAIDKYKTHAKQEYRMELWDTLTRGWSPGPALILTGPEGLEIPVLRKIGFKDDMLHLADKIAGYQIGARDLHDAKDASIYYGKLPEVFKTMAERGVKLKYANLDMCGTAAREALENLQGVSVNKGVIDGGRMAVTWWKARDGHWYEDVMHSLAGTDDRLGLVDVMVRSRWPGACRIGEGEYDNGSNGKCAPMQWGVWELV